MFRRPASPTTTASRTVCLAANTTWYVVNFRMRLIEHLQESGWRVVVCAPTDRHVERLASRGIAHAPMRLENAGTHPLRESATLFAMRRDLARIRPDVLLTFTPKVNIYGALAARTLGIPTVSNISGLGHGFDTGGWIERVSRELYRLALRWPSTVFFQNEEDRATFARIGLVDPSRTQRLPGSGVDVNRFAPPVPSRRSASFRFLLVARLLRAKGVVEFAEAARIVRQARPDVDFVLAGFVEDGNPAAVQRDEIEAWEREGILRFAGSFDDMVPVYADADCVVLPSYYREGVPRSLLEAASMERPVITTDSVGCRDTVVDGVTGFLVPPRDAGALATAMRRLLDAGPEVRSRMGRAARQRILREFDERRVIDAYDSAIASAVGPALAPSAQATA
jgi:glycosyltransferase involved in cell wall biosynthesis